MRLKAALFGRAYMPDPSSASDMFRSHGFPNSCSRVPVLVSGHAETCRPPRKPGYLLALRRDALLRRHLVHDVLEGVPRPGLGRLSGR